LGWISYPVYCLHYPIGRLAKFLGVGTHDPGYLPMGAGIAVTLAAAMALTRWYEEPVRAALSARRWRGVEGAVPK
jgi:peptidoglycan/LPS O-acetylase OafA/YrhL